MHLASSTTPFLPSQHGWPFGNKWPRTFLFGWLKISVGVCGGMCMAALQRFLEGKAIPPMLPDAAEKESLFREFWRLQLRLTPPHVVAKIFWWQMHSPAKQGYHTLENWPAVRDSLLEGKPVLITLVAHANDWRHQRLVDSHRVIAYAFEEESPPEGSETPPGAEQQVRIGIYDPNFPGQDHVTIAFFTGAEMTDIRLRHSRDENFYKGFFLEKRAL
jgi:hypothetical protein